MKMNALKLVLYILILVCVAASFVIMWVTGEDPSKLSFTFSQITVVILATSNYIDYSKYIKCGP